MQDTNFFENELTKLFANGNIMSDVRIAGRTCIGRIHGPVLAKIQFTSTLDEQFNTYNAISVVILNRVTGPIDQADFWFKDVLGLKEIEGRTMCPVIGRVGDGTMDGWQLYKPDQEDYAKLREAVGLYIGAFLPGGGEPA